MQTEISLPLTRRSAVRDWVIVLAYVGFIYATLGVAPLPLAYLRAHGFLRYTLAALFRLCWSAILGLLASRSRDVWRFIAMVAISSVYAVVARHLTTPEEQLHFVQYGLVGILFVRAVRPVIRDEKRSYAVALLLATLAGALDEAIQGYLPNRHFDVSDIGLNAVSSALGLAVYSILPQRHRP